MNTLGQFQKNQADDATCAAGDSFSVINRDGSDWREGYPQSSLNVGGDQFLPSNGGFGSRAGSYPRSIPPPLSCAGRIERNRMTRAASNFPGDMASTLAQAARVTRLASGRTAVELGGGGNLVAQEKSAATGAESRGSRRQTIHGKSVKGSVTRYERLGASPKALRSEDRGADFLEAIC